MKWIATSLRTGFNTCSKFLAKSFHSAEMSASPLHWRKSQRIIKAIKMCHRTIMNIYRNFARLLLNVKILQEKGKKKKKKEKPAGGSKSSVKGSQRKSVI